MLTGVTLDAATGSPLAGANVTLRLSGLGQPAAGDGSFRFDGNLAVRDTLRVTYMGYEPLILPVTFSGTDSLFFLLRLRPIILSMPEITVAAPRYLLERELIGLDPSALNLSPRQLQQIPQVVFADLFRSLQKQPGVISGTEASPQLHIRGGNMDQNLVLLDGAPVYYPFHFLGISSSFNMDALDAVTLSPGGFSAYFGNRLSSVVSLASRQPQKEWKTTVNIQLIGLDITTGGKIGNAFGWIGSIRAGYFDLAEKLGVKDIPYAFQDGMTALHFDPSPRQHLQLSLFGNNDALDLDEKSTDWLYSSTDTTRTSYTGIRSNNLNWQNRLVSAQWDYLLTGNLRFHAAAYHSGYRNKFQKERTAEFPEKLDGKFYKDRRRVEQNMWENNVCNQSHVSNRFRERGVKLDALWSGGKMLWIAGAERSWYRADYSWDRLYDDFEESYVRLFFDYAPETDFSYYRRFQHTAGFVESKITLLDSLTLRPGLRLTKWSFFRRYIPEPRLNLRYNQPNWHISLATGRYSQGVATALEEGLVGFLELYFPMEKGNGPAIADHYIIDYSRNLTGKTSFSIAAYYKDFPILLKAVDDPVNFVNSSGASYGLEFGFNTKYRGWDFESFYTWSHSKRRYGKLEYDANFDQRHRIQLSLRRQLPGRLNFYAYWEFHSGQPYCPGLYYAFIPTFEWPNHINYKNGVLYSPYEMEISRDRIRYPYYHRLDIMITLSIKKSYAIFSPYISLYNAYWRRNVLYYRQSRFTEDWVNGTFRNPHLERDPVTLPMIPSVGLKIEF